MTTEKTWLKRFSRITDEFGRKRKLTDFAHKDWRNNAKRSFGRSAMDAKKKAIRNGYNEFLAFVRDLDRAFSETRHD